MKKLARSPVRAVGLSALFAALAGCGGGGTIVSSIPYEGPVSQADYAGKTFPVYFLVGEPGDRPGKVLAAKGTITYNTDDTVTMQLPGRAPVVFSPNGTTALGMTYQSADAVDAVITSFSSNAFRLATSTNLDRSFLGGFGFETLAADRPTTSATYSTAGAVFLTTPGSVDFLPIEGDGELVANFGAGTISGPFLSILAEELELVGDGFNDELKLQFELENGRITSAGFSGGMSAKGEINIDGGSPSSIDVIVSNGSAEGAFYGEEAAAVAGIFEGGLALSDGGTSLADFEAAGFVSGAKTP